MFPTENVEIGVGKDVAVRVACIALDDLRVRFHHLFILQEARSRSSPRVWWDIY